MLLGLRSLWEPSEGSGFTPRIEPPEIIALAVQFSEDQSSTRVDPDFTTTSAIGVLVSDD